MGYYNKNVYKYDGHSNPFVWRDILYPFHLSFEEKIERWKKESSERNRVIEAKEHTTRDTKNKKSINNESRKIALKKKNSVA